MSPDLDCRSRISWFKTLGLFLGRALLDSRIIDVNLNKVFLKLILGKPVKKTIVTLKVTVSLMTENLLIGGPLVCGHDPGAFARAITSVLAVPERNRSSKAGMSHSLTRDTKMRFPVDPYLQPASTRRTKLAALTIGGAKLQDLSLAFTLPGYDIELKVRYADCSLISLCLLASAKRRSH